MQRSEKICMAVACGRKLVVVSPAPRTTAEQRRQAERVAAPASRDDRTVLVGMNRPATAEELSAFVAREQARIRVERELPPAA
jgi:hypothetical protein